MPLEDGCDSIPVGVPDKDALVDPAFTNDSRIESVWPIGSQHDED